MSLGGSTLQPAPEQLSCVILKQIILSFSFFGCYQQLRFGVFREGVFQKMPAIGGAISERNCYEICRRKSPQNTEKHKRKLCAEVPERPLPKDPFFSAADVNRVVADVCGKDVWDFQAKSWSSGSCLLFLHFLGKIAVQKKCLGKPLEVPDILLPDICGLLS